MRAVNKCSLLYRKKHNQFKSFLPVYFWYGMERFTNAIFENSTMFKPCGQCSSLHSVEENLFWASRAEKDYYHSLHLLVVCNSKATKSLNKLKIIGIVSVIRCTAIIFYPCIFLSFCFHNTFESSLLIQNHNLCQENLMNCLSQHLISNCPK